MIRNALLIAAGVIALAACSSDPAATHPTASVSPQCAKAHQVGSEIAAAIAAQGHPDLKPYTQRLLALTRPSAHAPTSIAIPAGDVLVLGAAMRRYIDWQRITDAAVKLEHATCR